MSAGSSGKHSGAAGPRRLIGAIDQGTSSTRFAVVDDSGAILAMAQAEHAQIFPGPGLVEHDAGEILLRVRQTAAAAMAELGITARDLAAIGITNQRETTVLWDRRSGKPLHNALVWQDTRVEGEVAALARGGGRDRLRAATGLPLASYFSALKLQWLLDHVPGARALAEAGDALFGTIDCFLAWSLTGEHVTDVTNASRTQLMDLQQLQWSTPLLELFRIPAACLPRIVPTSGRIGTIRGEAAGALAGATLAALVGDQQAALIGQACFDPGDAKNTYGTGNFLLMNTGTSARASTAGLITTLAYQLGGGPAHYALEGSIAVTGSLVQWLRDSLGLISSAAQCDALAAAVDDCGGVHIVPAFSGLYAPYWREDARGVITGLTRYADRRHLCRAALEAAAFQTADVVDAMQADSGVSLRGLRVDGGMTRSHLMLQIQADILGTAVILPRFAETTVLGAAYAAGLAAGIWPGPEALRAQWQAAQRFEPSISVAAREQRKAAWHRAVEKSFGSAG